MVPIQRVLLPTDFSECSTEATQYAFHFAEKLAAELHLLHVIEDLRAVVPDYYYGAVEWPQDLLQQMEAGALQGLEKLVDDHRAGGLKTILAVRQGKPFEQIVQYAKEHEIDLVVIGSHGRSGLGRFLMGSVAERVVRHAGCPVLTVRPDASQETT